MLLSITLFLYYSGNPPTLWDLLSAIKSGELGIWGYTPNSFEALARNFYDGGTGGCRYSDTNNQYNCSYSNIINWLGGTFWIQSVTHYDSGGVYHADPYINVLRLGNLKPGQIKTFSDLRQRNGVYPTKLLHQEIQSGGMFDYDGAVKDGSAQYGVTGINAGLIALSWRTGQADDYPSKWGDKPIGNDDTSYTVIANEQFDPLIFHNFSYVDTNGKLRVVVTMGDNTRYGDQRPPESGRPNDSLPQGVVVSPYCTYVSLITTTEGGIAVANCPTPLPPPATPIP